VSAQTLLIDACIAANVKRFIPSDFGSDLTLPAVRSFPVFAGKAQIQDYLVGKTKDGQEGEGGGLSYTIVNCGVIFDLSLGEGPINIPGEVCRNP